MTTERDTGQAAAEERAAARVTDVAVIGGSAAARRRAVAARPEFLGRPEISRLLSRIRGVETKDLSGEPHVTLSMQVPWVEDRGHLNLINPQSAYPDDPNVGFISPQGNNVEGTLELWLRGLEPGANYVAQFRASSYPLISGQPGQWKISSSEGPHVTVQATGINQTIPVLLLDADGPLALVKLTSTGLGGWVFYDAQVHKLE